MRTDYSESMTISVLTLDLLSPLKKVGIGKKERPIRQ
jgi:hypothetical protein